jgi:hypothetical protein
MLMGLGLPFFFLPLTAHALTLDGMTQGQSVMLATNEIMAST